VCYIRAVDPPPPIIEQPADLPRPVLPIERAAAAVEVILCSGFPTQLVIITVLAAFGMKPILAGGELSPSFVFTLTLLDTVLLLGLILFFLRAHRESARDTFLASRRPVREVMFGIALIPISFLVVVSVLMLLQLVVPGLRNVPRNPLEDLAHTRANAIEFALIVMIAGGLREEVQRAFVLRRFEQYLGGGPLGLVLFSAIFGLGHVPQGHDVAVATAILGAFWGAVYLRRRSILAPMVAHAGFNLAQVAKFVIAGG
jgi:membrane protease YdiL (CAAX protease family)